MKTQGLLRRRLAVGIGVIAIGAMGTLSACAGEEKKEAPTTTTTTTTTTTPPSVEPTEKGLNPGGGNKFTPTVKAPPAPTAIPGDN
jgi:hypothetical protein